MNQGGWPFLTSHTGLSDCLMPLSAFGFSLYTRPPIQSPYFRNASDRVQEVDISLLD